MFTVSKIIEKRGCGRVGREDFSDMFSFTKATGNGQKKECKGQVLFRVFYEAKF